MGSINDPARFSLVDNLTQDWLIPYALSSSAIAVGIGDLMYAKSAASDVAYPADQLATLGTEAADQANFAALFCGVSQQQVLSTETNAKKRITLRVDGVMDFNCPSQTWQKGQLVGVFSNGTTLDPQQVDSVSDTSLAIGVCVRAATVATTRVRVRLIARFSDFLAEILNTTNGNTLAFPRNLLDGGDFTTNPWQRNIGGLATSNVITSAISNTVTYFPDRWFAVGGASSSILLAQIQNDTSIAGFNQSCKFSRSSGNANTAVINFGQVLESADSYRCQSKVVTFSFWAKKGANYSGGAVTVQVISGTGTNDTAAHMVSASWTGQTNVVNTTQVLTTSMVRYSFTGLVPSGCTQLGVLFGYTPSGTAGADDSITFNGLQLEIGASATPFEHRDIELELALCQRYCFIIPEPASGVVVGSGMVAATNAEIIYIPFPTQMYKAPTVTVAAGSFKFNVAGTLTAVAGFAGGTTHTANAMSLVGTTTATSGQATNLSGGGGAGYVLASADF